MKKLDMDKTVASQMSDWDFLVTFTNYFGLRRSTELIGHVTMWRLVGLVPGKDFSLTKLIAELDSRGVSSRASVYRAARDLKEYVLYFEQVKEGFTLEELVDRLLEAKPEVSRMRDTVVNS